MAEVSTAHGNSHRLALASLQDYTLEALELFLRTLYARRGARHIDLCHLFGIYLRVVAEHKLHVETLDGRLYLQVAILERGVGETESEGVGHSHLFVVIPAIAHQTLFRVVGDELLGAVVAAVACDVYKDVALTVALNVLRHRLVLSYEAAADNVTADDIITRILDFIPVP